MTKPSSLTVIKSLVFSATITVLALLGYDIFFSKPLIMQGIIVDKVYVPSKMLPGQMYFRTCGINRMTIWSPQRSTNNGSLS
jgi:hypothetical protein